MPVATSINLIIMGVNEVKVVAMINLRRNFGNIVSNFKFY